MIATGVVVGKHIAERSKKTKTENAKPRPTAGREEQDYRNKRN